MSFLSVPEEGERIGKRKKRGRGGRRGNRKRKKRSRSRWKRKEGGRRGGVPCALAIFRKVAKAGVAM